MNHPNPIDKETADASVPSNLPGRFRLKLGDHLDSADTKRSYNEKLFTEIAPRYDFITRALSFWRDAAWKRDLVARLPGRSNPFCLDLACGTGDITLLVAQKYPQGTVVGLDITESMLVRARARNRYPQVEFLNRDMGSIGFAPEHADIVTGGYALRNAPDLAATLDAVHRVLKPAGIAAFLDFSKPVGPFPQLVEYWLLKIWAGFWGLLLHGNQEVYGYIAESLRRFPNRAELHAIVEERGFIIVSSRVYFFGIMELLVLTKK